MNTSLADFKPATLEEAPRLAQVELLRLYARRYFPRLLDAPLPVIGPECSKD